VMDDRALDEGQFAESWSLHIKAKVRR
jgi:hypothetical protein